MHPDHRRSLGKPPIYLRCIFKYLRIAVFQEAQLVTLITGAGSLFLGLSWLIGGSLQEVLTSIIFLFVKHPYDVGDRIVVDKVTYTVKEIRLLSTVMLDSNSCLVQAPNTVLSAKVRPAHILSAAYTFNASIVVHREYSTKPSGMHMVTDMLCDRC